MKQGAAHAVVPVLLIALLVLVAGCARSNSPDKPLLLILAGQSNMVGQGASDDLTDEQRAWPASVLFFDSGHRAVPATTDRFGPELSLGQKLAAAISERDIRLVKYARGGTSLLAWSPEWDSTRAQITQNAAAGPLYADLLSIVDSVRSGGDFELGAIFWMQGERDARFEDAGAEYFPNLAYLIESLRSDLGEPDLPFILGLVNPPADAYPALGVVRQSQRRAATEISNVYVVDTDDLTKWDDNLHYDTTGILELGRRFAVAFGEAADVPLR